MKRAKNSVSLRFQIFSGTGYLSFVRGLIHALKLPIETASKCSSALIEGIDNAIFHAHKKDYDKLIDIAIEVSGRKVVMGVKDRGNGFDLKKIPKPKIDQTHGRGLFIIKSLMDRVEYKNNTLRMWFE